MHNRIFPMLSLLTALSFLACNKNEIASLGTQPTASFSVTPVTAANNTYLLQNTTPGAFNYIWTNYNGESQTGVRTTGSDTLRVYYPDSGSYRVNLLVTTSGGFDSLSQNIDVAQDDPSVYVTGFPGSELWVTDPDNNSLFYNKKLKWKKADNALSTLKIDPAQSYQSIDGFGFTLTGGSAQLLSAMNSATQDAVLQELFDTTGKNIGISYIRLSIGASDMNDHVFTYDDMPAGQTDPELANFNLGPDSNTVVPILKKILAINPHITIMATPWSAPSWMKDNNSMVAGSLKTAYYNVYARYFVKYLQTMNNLGIPIAAITPQNEPLNGNNNPSMLMQSSEQAAFVQVLGPALKTAGLTTKIIVWDHNADNAAYPVDILSDPSAAAYVDGSAFHLYAGDISALSTVHNQFPAKNLYFTEQWVGYPSNLKGDLNWHVENLVIGAPRNWSRNVLEWNLASDPQQKPHTDGGCSNCLGALTIDGNNFTRNTSYYIIAHASKFVRPGSVRIASNMIEGLPNIAFRTPARKTVLIVLNTGSSNQAFNIQIGDAQYSTDLNSGAVGTFIL